MAAMEADVLPDSAQRVGFRPLYIVAMLTGGVQSEAGARGLGLTLLLGFELGL
jgi:hypothetical protein